jgi:uncharacterized protein YjbJ (UPF0337 family)
MSDKELRDEGREDISRGKLEEAVGKAAGSDKLETEGRVHQAEGEMKQGLGDADRSVSDAADAARDTLNE